ncbi:MAG: YfcC family protein [Bacteroidales bacterium]|nr:YfcC family protein [Bacteroidales bacterium]
MNGKTRTPNTYVILFALILLCAVATWLLPGGHYEKGADGALSFVPAESVPQTWQVFSALYEGFKLQAGIIAFILIVGGAFWVLNETDAVSYGIRGFIARAGKYDRWVLVSVALLFSLAGAVFGMSEETIPFVGIVVPLVVSLGYDAVTGLLIVYVAANIGFSAAFLNPFTVGIAQEMAGLPLFSGMGYRIFCWALLTAALIGFVLWYAGRVRTNPAGMCPERGSRGLSDPDPTEAERPDGAVSTRAQRWILLILGATVVALILGATLWHWYITEISALFLAMGIVCGAVAGFRPGRIAEAFVAGAKDILSAALVVGLASGAVVILQDGAVMDSILHGLESGLGESGRTGALSMMYGIQTVINLLIPSATAKAAITVPVMAPFSDMIGLSRQACVLAFQFGDGFTNMLTPTSGVLIAALAMAKVSYTEWVSFAWKYVLVLILAGFILLLPTVLFPLAGF